MPQSDASDDDIMVVSEKHAEGGEDDIMPVTEELTDDSFNLGDGAQYDISEAGVYQSDIDSDDINQGNMSDISNDNGGRNNAAAAAEDADNEALSDNAVSGASVSAASLNDGQSITIAGSSSRTVTDSRSYIDVKDDFAAEGIVVYSEYGANSKVNVSGDVKVTIPTGEDDRTNTDGSAIGIYDYNKKNTTINIGGDVIAKDESKDVKTNYMSSTGIYAGYPKLSNVSTLTGKSTINIGGSVISDDRAEGSNGITIVDQNIKDIDINVGGDIKGETYGVFISNNTGDINIVTAGTISGGKAAIAIDNYYVNGAAPKQVIPNITVWKLECGSDIISSEQGGTGSSTAGKTDSKANASGAGTKADSESALITGKYTYAEPVEVEEDGKTVTKQVVTNQSAIDAAAKNINYIIKSSVTENGAASSNGKIVLKGEQLGSVTIGGKSYSTAHQDQTITINVETVSGYKYSLSNGEALLTANKDGSYTLKVPAGGGVELNAVLSKIVEKKSDNSSSASTTSRISTASYSSSGGGGGGGSGGGGGGGGGGLGGSKGVIAGTAAALGTQLGATANSGSTGSTIPSTPGAWAKDAANNWIYTDTSGKQYKNDWIAASNRWYYLNESGNPLTGWQQIKGVWYYFSATDTTANPLGSMYVSATTPDGYKVDAEGKYVS